MAAPRDVLSTLSHDTSRHDHDRAERLLASVQDCADPDLRARAQHEAVLLTLDLADSVARRYRGRGIDLDDLTQVARLALVKAAQGYRSGLGNSFAAYATPTISGEIKRHFRDCGWAVRPPRRLQEIRATLGGEEERLRQHFQREPTTQELATVMELAPDDIHRARGCAAAYRAVSLDAPTSIGAFDHAVAAGSDVFASFDVRDALDDALTRMTPRERHILRLRFVDERTQSEIGAVLGVSQMQVSRLLSSILTRLRQDLLAADRAA